MKHMRKALSLFLALAMIICFAVPAFAADTDTATVTVYVTTGMFTPGGYDPDHGTFLEQEFRNQETLSDHLFNGCEAAELDGVTIAAMSSLPGQYMEKKQIIAKMRMCLTRLFAH